MSVPHPKSVRRHLLLLLYRHYLEDPLKLLAPEDLLEDGLVSREDLRPSVYYLHDSGLVELLTGFNLLQFDGVRISPKGIDLVENTFRFNLLFPPAPDELEGALADVPVLIERLVEQADFAPLDGEVRQALLRDIQYLREELARPAERWRAEVVHTVIGWIEGHFENPQEHLEALATLKARLQQTFGDCNSGTGY